MAKFIKDPQGNIVRPVGGGWVRLPDGTFVSRPNEDFVSAGGYSVVEINTPPVQPEFTDAERIRMGGFGSYAVLKALMGINKYNAVKAAAQAAGGLPLLFFERSDTWSRDGTIENALMDEAGMTEQDKEDLFLGLIQ